MDHAEQSNDSVCCQEISFGANVVVQAHIRLSERDARLNRKLLRATLLQPGLTELTISEMLPQDLDAGLVRHIACKAPEDLLQVSQWMRLSSAT